MKQLRTISCVAALAACLLCSSAATAGGPTGACCDPLNSTCFESSQGFCEESAGFYLGDGTTCEGGLCDDFGACCYPEGFCKEDNPSACLEIGGSPQGAGTICDKTICEGQQLGACCLGNGDCLDSITESLCFEKAGGQWQGPGSDCLNCGGPGCLDFDGSGDTGFGDLVILLSNWGPCLAAGIGPPCYDLTGDFEVGFDDLVILLSEWGPCGRPL